MTTPHNSQRGDATTIVFALLTIGLIVAVGIIFYQNYSAQKTEQARIDAINSKIVDKDPIITTDIAFNSTIYQLDHPTSWVAATSKNIVSNQGGTVTTITNPDKTIQVTLDISELSKPLDCDASSDLKIKYYDAASQPIATKLSGAALYMVAAIYDHEEEGYDYAIGLTPDSGASHAAVGEPRCDVAPVGRVSETLRDKETNALKRPTIDATIIFTKLPEPPKAASYDMQGIKKYLEANDYKTAVGIIESARAK